jgi:hypothetical protein
MFKQILLRIKRIFGGMGISYRPGGVTLIAMFFIIIAVLLVIASVLETWSIIVNLSEEVF